MLTIYPVILETIEMLRPMMGRIDRHDRDLGRKPMPPCSIGSVGSSARWCGWSSDMPERNLNRRRRKISFELRRSRVGRDMDELDSRGVTLFCPVPKPGEEGIDPRQLTCRSISDPATNENNEPTELRPAHR